MSLLREKEEEEEQVACTTRWPSTAFPPQLLFFSFPPLVLRTHVKYIDRLPLLLALFRDDADYRSPKRGRNIKKERKINTVVLLRICVEASATSNAGQVRSPLLTGLRPALRLTAKSRRFTTLFWPLEASHFPPLSLTFPLQQQHTDKKERKEDDKNVRVEMLCVSMARLISTQSSYRSNKIFPQPSIKLRSSKKKKSYLPIGFATKSRNTANLDSRAFIRELSTLSREKYGQWGTKPSAAAAATRKIRPRTGGLP